jgi:hypothetical protein
MADQQRMTSPRDADPIGSLWRQVVRLPPAQQLDLFARLGDYLDDRPAKLTALYVNAKARARALADLRRVCADLGRDPKIGITVREYDAIAKRDGLMLSGTVLRAYNGWENAEAVLRGEEIPRTPQQMARLREARQQGHTREERFAMIREFLASSPPKTTRCAYDEWAVEANAKRQAGDPLLVTSAAIARQSGGGGWPALVALARGENAPALAEAEYPLFISVGLVASLLGSSQVVADREDFPRPVARSSYCRIWLRDEVIAYRDGKRFDLRPSFWMQRDLLFTRDIAARLGLAERSVRRRVQQQDWLRGRIPEPCAESEHVVIVWWRRDVESFFEQQRA